MPHVMELFGKTRVVIKDGKVIEVGKSLMDWCPVFDKVSGVKKIDPEEAKKNMEDRIRQLGMFTNERKFDSGIFVTFGASEIMMSGLRCGIIDATVTVCEGAGTVITANPELVQGMGAQMSGLIETEPIEGIIKGITERNGTILDPSSAKIDQIAGLVKAVDMGFRRIAVSVTDPFTARELRDKEKELGVEVIIIGAHLTGANRVEAYELIGSLDIITGCASGNIRNMIKPLLQVGTSVPMFALTQKGKELLIERVKDVDNPVLIHIASLPSLPPGRQPRPLII